MRSPYDHEATYLFRYDRGTDRFTAKRDPGSEPHAWQTPDDAILFVDRQITPETSTENEEA